MFSFAIVGLVWLYIVLFGCRFVSVSCSDLYCFVLILCYFIFFRFDLVCVGLFSGLCGKVVFVSLFVRLLVC